MHEPIILLLSPRVNPTKRSTQSFCYGLSVAYDRTERGEFSTLERSGPNLAFTRYCHCQYSIVYGIQRRGRWGGVYCAMVVHSIAIEYAVQG